MQWYGTISVKPNQPMQRVIPKHRVGKLTLLTAMIDGLVGGSTLTLIGDLRRCEADLDAIPGVFWHERGTRATLPLEPSTRDQIVRRILPRIGLAKHIQHVLIAKNGVVGFRSEDWFLFRLGFVQTGPAVSEAALLALVERGIITGFDPVEQRAEQVR